VEAIKNKEVLFTDGSIQLDDSDWETILIAFIRCIVKKKYYKEQLDTQGASWDETSTEMWK
jgi:hypothetical protein